MSKITYFTKEGLKKLNDELHHLKTKGRADIAKQIAEARDKGDLSENAEYDAAKDAQGLHELKISKLEESISNARIIDESDINTDKVSILSKVKIENLNLKKEFQYTIVSEEESNLQEGKISIKSPIGMGLLGKKKGEIVSVNVPSGKIKFKIIDISL
ncbi:MAG: transcription elongation factor GreA [Bacteroidota bacterium]|jgi:transcription elongation factor GreA|nr:transcription elongation factor GreA [Bacteroidota bacterium]